MKRTPPLVLFACLGLAACTRSADPLEWKIPANDPAELQGWVDRDLPLMPKDLSIEVFGCLTRIRADTSRGPNGQQRNHRLCQRLNGRTVREALIEGHELANQSLRAQIVYESDQVVRLLGKAHTLGPEELKKQEALMNAHLASRDGYEKRLRDSEARVAALQAGERKP